MYQKRTKNVQKTHTTCTGRADGAPRLHHGCTKNVPKTYTKRTNRVPRLGQWRAKAAPLIKAINQCKTRYKPTQTERCEPVNKRAAEIPDEYIKKLREKDRRYHNTANGEVGPMEEALISYDGCSGLVGGFYGEFSKDVNRLIKLA